MGSVLAIAVEANNFSFDFNFNSQRHCFARAGADAEPDFRRERRGRHHQPLQNAFGATTDCFRLWVWVNIERDLGGGGGGSDMAVVMVCALSSARSSMMAAARLCFFFSGQTRRGPEGLRHYFKGLPTRELQYHVCFVSPRFR